MPNSPSNLSSSLNNKPTINNKNNLSPLNNNSILGVNSYKKYLNPSFIEPVNIESYPLNLNTPPFTEA